VLGQNLNCSIDPEAIKIIFCLALWYRTKNHWEYITCSMNSGLGWTKFHLRILNLTSSLNLACFKLSAEYNFPEMDPSSLTNYKNLFMITSKLFGILNTFSFGCCHKRFLKLMPFWRFLRRCVIWNFFNL